MTNILSNKDLTFMWHDTFKSPLEWLQYEPDKTMIMHDYK